MDRVENADQRETYITGEGCLPVIDARGFDEAAWVAREINRVFGRHGASKRNSRLAQDQLMNLLEAREFAETS